MNPAETIEQLDKRNYELFIRKWSQIKKEEKESRKK